MPGSTRSPEGRRGATSSRRSNREGLKQVIRRDRHDREEIWFVLADSSNLVAMVEDALAVIGRVGLVWVEEARPEVVREHAWRVREGLVGAATYPPGGRRKI